MLTCLNPDDLTVLFLIVKTTASTGHNQLAVNTLQKRNCVLSADKGGGDWGGAQKYPTAPLVARKKKYLHCGQVAKLIKMATLVMP